MTGQSLSFVLKQARPVKKSHWSRLWLTWPENVFPQKQFTNVISCFQFPVKMASQHSEMPIHALPHLSAVSPKVALETVNC